MFPESQRYQNTNIKTYCDAGPRDSSNAIRRDASQGLPQKTPPIPGRFPWYVTLKGPVRLQPQRLGLGYFGPGRLLTSHMSYVRNY